MQSFGLKVQGVKRTDVGLNPLMVRHCHPVLLKYCGGTEGQERMQCLEDHVESPETTAACRSRVLDEPILRSKSVLLNPKVGTACKADLNFLIRTRRCKAPFQRLMLAHKDSGKMPYGIAGAGRRLRGNDNVIDEVKKELKKKKKAAGLRGKGLLGKGLISEMGAAELRAAVKAASEELSGRDIECLLEHEGAEQNHPRRSKKKTATIWKDPSKRWKGVQPMCKQALLTVKRDRAKDLRARTRSAARPRARRTSPSSATACRKARARSTAASRSTSPATASFVWATSRACSSTSSVRRARRTRTAG